MDSEFVWLELPETGGKQRFASAAVEAWKARGWRECDPPEEPNPTRELAAEEPPAALPVPVDEPDVEPDVGPADDEAED